MIENNVVNKQTKFCKKKSHWRKNNYADINVRMSHWPANHLLYKCSAKFFNNTHALYVKLQLDNDKKHGATSKKQY